MHSRQIRYGPASCYLACPIRKLTCPVFPHGGSRHTVACVRLILHSGHGFACKVLITARGNGLATWSQVGPLAAALPLGAISWDCENWLKEGAVNVVGHVCINKDILIDPLLIYDPCRDCKSKVKVLSISSQIVCVFRINLFGFSYCKQNKFNLL
jgi:hypothetical protein